MLYTMDQLLAIRDAIKELDHPTEDQINYMNLADYAAGCWEDIGNNLDAIKQTSSLFSNANIDNELGDYMLKHRELM